MTELLSDEAVRAAAVALRLKNIAGLESYSTSTWRDYAAEAQTALSAAAPFMEAAVRAKIADEIEAVDWMKIRYVGISPMLAREAIRAAAAVARGTQEAPK